MTIETAGSIIRSARRRKRLTGVYVAACADMTPAYLSQIENGIRQLVDPNKRKALAQLLDIPLDFLLVATAKECGSVVVSLEELEGFSRVAA